MSRRRGPKDRVDHGLGGEHLEGRQAVREALAAGRRGVRCVWMARGLPPSPPLAEICELARSAGVLVRMVSAEEISARARTESPQGVLARADPLPASSLEDLLSRADPFLVALDGVTDPGNLGAVLRGAEGAGVTGVVVPRHRGAHLSPAALKAAAGAAEHLPLAMVPGVPAMLLAVQRQGLFTLGLEGGAEESLFEAVFPADRIVLVLGGEGAGLSRLTRARCEGLVSIPMLGRLPSLNVASAAALACYEVARRRAEARPG